MPLAYVLKQVRESRHLELEAVASYAHISAARLAAFEAGSRDPSFLQLEKLAQIYGVTAFALASKQLPNLKENLVDFRKSEPSPAHLSPGAMRKLWMVENISYFTSQLKTEVNFASNRVFEKSEYSEGTPASAVALRRKFNVWMREREDRLGLSGSSEQIFLASLRLFIESHGIVVNIDEAPSADYFGFFASPEGGISSIFINREVASKKAQLFTLLHELCHYFLDLQGISDPFKRRNDIERKCNRFAASFLAPMRDFITSVKGQSRDTLSDPMSLIAEVSRTSLLSNMATAIRLREADFLTRSQLQQYVAVRGRYSRTEKDEERASADAAMAPPQAARISTLGYLPVYLAQEAINQKLIDKVDVQQSLGLSMVLQERAFSLGKYPRGADLG